MAGKGGGGLKDSALCFNRAPVDLRNGSFAFNLGNSETHFFSGTAVCLGFYQDNFPKNFDSQQLCHSRHSLQTPQQEFLSQEAWVPPASAKAALISWGLGTGPLTGFATDTLSDGRLAVLCVQTGFFFFFFVVFSCGT